VEKRVHLKRQLKENSNYEKVTLEDDQSGN
jgi:hypothetical protein